MPGLVPGIHDLGATRQDVDGQVKPGHDDVEAFGHEASTNRFAAR